MHEISYDSPLGAIRLRADDTALTGLRFAPPAPRATTAVTEHPVLAAARRQLDAYFQGERTAFHLPVRLTGGAWERRVWAELAAIPYGTTTSYGELAARLGAPHAARAVGAANARNPVGIVIPCHRVIGASGALTGYAGGLERKAALLALERGALPLAPAG